jgi:hypothetical protein
LPPPPVSTSSPAPPVAISALVVSAAPLSLRSLPAVSALPSTVSPVLLVVLLRVSE